MLLLLSNFAHFDDNISIVAFNFEEIKNIESLIFCIFYRLGIVFKTVSGAEY